MALVRHSLRDQIREQLLKRIGDGDLPPGRRIVESALAREFGVSSIPVREAIRELVAMGVLQFANHKGAWVRQVSMEETAQALEVKAALEALAAREPALQPAARNRRLRTALKGLTTAARAGNLAAYQRNNHEFHLAIVEAGGNQVLLKIWKSLAFEVRTRPLLQVLKNPEPVQVACEHEDILAALEAGKLDLAATLLASHASRLIEAVRAEQPQPKPVPIPARLSGVLRKRTSRIRTPHPPTQI